MRLQIHLLTLKLGSKAKSEVSSQAKSEKKENKKPKTTVPSSESSKKRRRQSESTPAAPKTDLSSCAVYNADICGMGSNLLPRWHRQRLRLTK